jgi:hypothetical protein
MPRPDLLALTPDDLAALANRGLVKRAQREVESGEFTAQWQDAADDTVVAQWSDNVTCTLPGAKTVREAICNCGALELCRHVLRTVLAWQLRQASSTTNSAAHPPAPWDPGRITEAMLEAQVSKQVRDRATALWSQGILGEALRSAKPSMRFHCPGHTVRFPVPDDLRYAQCSCADPAPCIHAVLAVRAFRLLAPEVSSGIVSEGPLDAPVPPEPIAAARACVTDLLVDGFASLGTAWRDRVRRVATECAAVALMWPAQILEELAEDFDRYTARDAAFTPSHTADRLGELLLRLDAIAAGCAPIPQAFIRGMKSDRDCELGAARFIGLGASVVEERRSTTVNVFLQDCDNGHVVALMRETSEDPNSTGTRKPYHQLARATAVKDASMALLAGGQLVTQGGRRKASGQLVIGRARAVVNPQSFAWEQLKAPVLVEDFGELRERLKLLPPASFRPRRAAADFHVCPIAAVESANFQPTVNSIVAVLHDRSGDSAVLVHPWTERGQGGADALLASLRSSKPLFVAGHVRASGDSLTIHPTAFVFEEPGPAGPARRAILPWIDHPAKSAASGTSGSTRPHSHSALPLSHSRYRPAAELASELVLNGLRRIAHRQWPGWSRAITETEERGYHQMAAILREIQTSGQPGVETLRLLKLLAMSRDASA